MIRYAIALVAALAALPNAATAQSPIHWAGKGVVETVSAGCSAFGVQAGENLEATVMPLQVQASPGPWSNNGSFIRLTNDWEQMSLNINGDLVTNTSAQQVALTRIIRPGGAYQHQITMSRITVNPSTITPTTTNLKLSVTVSNFYGGPNCTVRLGIWLVKVPEEQQSARSSAKANPFNMRAPQQ